MVVGHDIAVGRDQEAGADALPDLRALAALALAGHAVVAEATEELAQLRRHVLELRRRPVAVAHGVLDLDAHRHDRRLHLVDDVGEGRRRLGVHRDRRLDGLREGGLPFVERRADSARGDDRDRGDRSQRAAAEILGHGITPIWKRRVRRACPNIGIGHEGVLTCRLKFVQVGAWYSR